MHNPSLRAQPRDQNAPIIPSTQQSSILDWLAQSGRLIARDAHERDFALDEEEIEEINELMSSDSGSYFEDDDADLEE
jgi:hypothetical protein